MKVPRCPSVWILTYFCISENTLSDKPIKTRCLAMGEKTPKLHKIQGKKTQQRSYGTKITISHYDTNCYVLSHFPIEDIG